MEESAKTTQQKRTIDKKNTFLQVYKKKLCNITMTCDDIKIDRQTYYNWRKNDNMFDEECKAIEESLIDFAESQLLKNIKDGKETSLIFYLKCKAKKRGYVERQEHEHLGYIPVMIKDDV